MRYFLLILLCFFVSSTFSKTNVLTREIRWKDTNSISFEGVMNDSFGNPMLYKEIVDLPFSLNLKIEYLSWDTIKNNGKITQTSISNTFFYKKLIQTGVTNFHNEFLINVVRLASDTSKIIRLKKYSIYFDPSSKKDASITINSVLSTGKWHKIKIIKNGIYKLSYSQLKKMGFENPANVSLFGYAMGLLPKSTSAPTVDDLKKIPFVSDANNIYFFGSDAVNWNFNAEDSIFYHQSHKFSDTSYYFLTDGQGSPSIVETSDYTSTETMPVTSFDDFEFHEKDETNFIRSGSEWYGDRMGTRQQTVINYTFLDADLSYPAKIYYRVVTKSKSEGTMVINLGSTQAKIKIPFRTISSDLSAGLTNGHFSAPITGNNLKLVFEYQNSSESGAEGFIDYTGINIKRKLVFNGSPQIFRNQLSISSEKAIKYTIDNASENMQVWDISDKNYPIKMNLEKNGQQVSFIGKSGSLATYVMFTTSSGIMEPIIDNSGIKNQNIHGAEVPDLIIVSPDSSAIYEQANRLAQFRRNNDGLKVLLVTASEIYNEFSAGRRDATAIRNMVKYFYNRGLVENKKPSYLLLFGDGSYANKPILEGNTNLLPTHESEESLIEDNSYVTDDYFGWTSYNDLEEYNLLNIGVGRMPINNYFEAYNIVNKLLAYSNPSNDDDWRNILSFIADDEDYNEHLELADQLAQTIRSKYLFMDIRKIYLDAYVQSKTATGESYPGANEAINERINNGALIINYTGHGNERQLAHENIINVKSIRAWSNINKYPMFITATCEFSRWDDYNYSESKSFTSAGEEVLLNPKGGGIALLTTTRLVYSRANFELNKAFYKYAFEKDENGNYFRLGDLYRLTKNDAISTEINRLNFSLLGDPSLMLAYPKRNYIKTDSINKFKLIDSVTNADTLKALSVARVSGHFETDGVNYSFNGPMSVKVFDKPDTLSTLANDVKSRKYKFVRQESTIFKGLVNVVDGKFSFEFPVPVDIKLNVASGKIIYYAPSPEGSFTGFTEKLAIGNVAGDIENTKTGPDIYLFMNDTNFRDGGITTSDPKLLVKLEDKDGINASGIGIGHDITAVIDNDYTKIISLNSNYRTELNDYRKGSTSYSLYDLLPGLHSVKVTAWDIFNNPYEKDLNFRVVDNVKMELNRVVNYPNPMRDHVYFTIEHNKPNELIDIQLYIYTFTGSLVNILKYKGFASGFRTAPIIWNGTYASGRKAGEGVYPYKIVVTGEDGSSAHSNGKLVIIK